MNITMMLKMMLIGWNAVRHWRWMDQERGVIRGRYGSMYQGVWRIWAHPENETMRNLGINGERKPRGQQAIQVQMQKMAIKRVCTSMARACMHVHVYGPSTLCNEFVCLLDQFYCTYQKHGSHIMKKRYWQHWKCSKMFIKVIFPERSYEKSLSFYTWSACARNMSCGWLNL